MPETGSIWLLEEKKLFEDIPFGSESISMERFLKLHRPVQGCPWPGARMLRRNMKLKQERQNGTHKMTMHSEQTHQSNPNMKKPVVLWSWLPVEQESLSGSVGKLMRHMRETKPAVHAFDDGISIKVNWAAFLTCIHNTVTRRIWSLTHMSKCFNVCVFVAEAPQGWAPFHYSMLIPANARHFSFTTGLIGAKPSLTSVTVQTWNGSVYEADRFLLGCGGKLPLIGRSEEFLLLMLRGGVYTDSRANTKFVSSPQFECNATEDNWKRTGSAD